MTKKGQATLLVVTAIGLVLAGALGLAIDGAQIYGHRQMAQAAADAAAQSGAMSILGGTNTGTNSFGSAAFNCGATDSRTPCVYARNNGFGNATDTVAVDFPALVPGVTKLSPDFANAAVHVRITRSLNTTLMRFFGPSSTNVVAAATAAIVQVDSPVPILVLHPGLAGALRLQGNPTITICGGPQRSIQVNSISTSAIDLIGSSARVDLSKGGPADTEGDCSTGTGSDLGVFGGPSYGGLLPFWMSPAGTTSHYYQPSVKMTDPLSRVAPPAKPGATPDPAGTKMPDGTWGCPKDCYLYDPGYYPTGIKVKNKMAFFKPGVYYIDNGGFVQEANGDVTMCPGCASSVETGAGMLVYLSATGGAIDVTADSSASLRGSDFGSAYKGILFFVDRDAPAQVHSFGGGGDMELEGTVYATNATMTATHYQTVKLWGASGSKTSIKGEIITSVLSLGGNGEIKMHLNPDYLLPINQVALVR